MELTRREKIRLLLASLSDALGEDGAIDGLGGGRLGSRALRSGVLYREGSYGALDRCLAELKQRSPGVHWHTVEVYCHRNASGRGRNRKANLGIDFLMRRMPSNVYVPAELAENAGFPVADARAGARPRLRDAA